MRRSRWTCRRLPRSADARSSRRAREPGRPQPGCRESRYRKSRCRELRMSRIPTSRTRKSTTRMSRIPMSRIRISRTLTSKTRTSRIPMSKTPTWKTRISKTSSSPIRISKTRTIENPDVENPDVENPDIENPDIENVAVGGDGVLIDTTWNFTNVGNTTSSFNVNLFLVHSRPARRPEDAAHPAQDLPHAGGQAGHVRSWPTRAQRRALEYPAIHVHHCRRQAACPIRTTPPTRTPRCGWAPARLADHAAGVSTTIKADNRHLHQKTQDGVGR